MGNGNGEWWVHLGRKSFNCPFADRAWFVQCRRQRLGWAQKSRANELASPRDPHPRAAAGSETDLRPRPRLMRDSVRVNLNSTTQRSALAVTFRDLSPKPLMIRGLARDGGDSQALGQETCLGCQLLAHDSIHSRSNRSKQP